MERLFAVSSSVVNSIDCTKHKIKDIITGSQVPEDPYHAENTLDWLLRLKPDADDALQIAALGHDIERAIKERKVHQKDFKDYDSFKAAHARNSAIILKEIMDECGIDFELADEVYRLVSRHEVGGDPRSNLLKDADAISYFYTNLPLYYNRNGREKALERSIWGYRRLSRKRRQIVERIDYSNEVLNQLLKITIQMAS